MAFGAAEALTGLAPGQGTALVLLAVTGFTALYFTQAVNHRVQLGSAPASVAGSWRCTPSCSKDRRRSAHS